MNVMSKRPHEVLDYVFDFSRWLDEGDTISAAVGTISTSEGGTATVDSTDFDADKCTATVWVSGGVLDENAEITAKITTTAGRVKETVLKLRIRD